MTTTVTKSIKPAGGGDYSSIAGWVAGQAADFVSGDTIQRGECYAGQDTSAVAISGATTGAANYWDLEVLSAERHAGVYSTSKYRLEPTDADAFKIDDEYCRVYGMQTSIVSPTALRIEVEFRFITGASDVRYECFIVKGSGTNSAGFEASSNVTGTVKASNGIVYGCTATFNGNARWSNNTGSHCYLYNISFINGYYGIRNSAAAGTLFVKNCLCKGATNGDFVNDTSWGAGSDYNAASDASGTGGGHDRASQTFTFVNAGASDYHLAANDAGARNFGLDLGSDASYPISLDVDGEARGSPWNIGADGFLAVPGGNAPTLRSRFPEPATRSRRGRGLKSWLTPQAWWREALA